MAEYRVPTQQELIKDGKDLGYVGVELQTYVKEQQAKPEKKKQEAKAEKEKQDAKAEKAK